MSRTTIKAIDATSVHKITSGQVVIDLQTAVKELVENSLDAGATSIEVRFKDYGLKSIEVIDNGHGVAPEDYGSLALKHHTSKLASFEDLATVLTFGFRGEALSSLCSLSSAVSVTTATSTQAPMGTILEFDRTGTIKDRSGKVARKRGTSVTITGLFTPLPVRRKEFERNAKREYGKALSLLHAYALVPCANENKGVRLTVSNHPDKGARSVQIQTDGSLSSKASVSALWGPKSLDSIISLDLQLEVEAERSSVLKKRGMPQDGTTIVKVTGLISKFTFGCGRTSTDRQFFYVNGRPCSPIKVQKAFNEVYRSFNTNQAPFIVADFRLPAGTCDINVSPDKRSIFIHSENNLIHALKTRLEETFSPSRSTFLITGPSAKRKERPSIRHSARESSPGSDDSPRIQTEDGVRDDMEQGEDLNSLPDNHTLKRNGSQQTVKVDEVSTAYESRHSRSHSRLRKDIQPIVIEDDGENTNIWERNKDVDMADTNDEFDETVNSLSTPGVSVSVDLDGPLCRSIEPTHDVPTSFSPPQPPHPTPLFLPSPSSSLPSPLPPPPDPRQATSTRPLGHRRLSPSPPRSSKSDIQEERPRKRARISSPSPAPLLKPRPVQMVLGTAGAAWSLQVQRDSGDKDVDTRETAIKAGAGAAPNARDKIRTRLTAFVRPGSQMKPIPSDDEASNEGGGDNESDVDELKGTDTVGERDNSVQGMMIDEPRQVSQKSMGHVLEAGPGAETRCVDLTMGPRDDDDDISGQVQHDVGLIAGEDPPSPEIVRTATSDLTLRLDLNRLSSTWSRFQSSLALSLPCTPLSSQGLQPSANVANADDAEGAERELARVIHKEDFASMHVMGQFNLGFIIARRVALDVDERRSSDDLFIVDQHAADEKYNFETLQQTTKIESQRLFQPRPLELTAADELVAIENVDVLRSNGFEVVIDEDASAGQGQRIKLVAQPVSKSTTFDMKDLEELLHLMQDHPSGHMVRCSKARAMFAMRACRKSVMVGMPLTTGQMTSVVRHMGTMDQPWNCPHGRPTMRHLVSLSAVDRREKVTREVDWTGFV